MSALAYGRSCHGRVLSGAGPTWTHAAVCLTALQDLLKLGEGFMTDAVVDALKAHMQVVSYETFRGPPR
jgi:hypothetical protein